MRSVHGVCRIAHVITGLEVGGAEIALERLVSTTCGDEFRCRVWSLGPLGTVGRRMRDNGVDVRALGAKLAPSSAILPLMRLRSDLREFAPHVIQGWMYHGNAAATLCRPSLGPRTRLAWNIRGSLQALSEEKLSTRLLIRGSAWLSRVPDVIVNNSTASARAHERIGYSQNRWVVIPNGFDVERFAPSPDVRAEFRDRHRLEPSSIVVGAIGRFVPVKGHADLLRALETRGKDFGDVVVVFAGAGMASGDSNFSRMCRELAPRARIIALGQVERIESVLPALDLLCLPSRSEGFPNVLAEAMSCGVCCIVTDVGDAAWIVGDTGIVVPPSSVTALAEALAQVCKWDPQERSRRGLAGRARIATHFSLQRMRDSYLDLYRRLALPTVPA
jgi:glycosyltransferase involved in cell wall biosynthesis